MSQQQINLSPDLIRLQKEGYEVSIEHGHLIVRNIPYVTTSREVKKGILVSTLAVSGNQTNRPDGHVIMFSGDYPCDENGNPLEKIRNSSSKQTIGGELNINHRFSSKPKCGYTDYYEKMTTYTAILSSPAMAIDPAITPRTGRIIEAPDDSPFVYFDNASGRAGISAVTQKLKMESIMIIGLGGTGAHILDHVAKTPVEQIHVVDGDILEQHNAFRTPGAVTIEELRQRPFKVDHWAEKYSRIHKGIVPHREFLTADNLDLLQGQDIVFICIDANEAKVPIINKLNSLEIPFIDVGIGVELVDNGLTGMLRTTTSTPQCREHVIKSSRVPMKKRNAEDIYANNIQISELNAMNACQAVIKWKKLCGFYKDLEHEHFSIFTLDGNRIINEDRA